MCVRYVRGCTALDYVAPLMSRRAAGLAHDFLPSWNVVPGTRQPVIGPAGVVRRLCWGVPSHGAPETHLVPGRRMRTIVDASTGHVGSAALQEVWARGRVIVPADGWFEWRPDAHGRQPYFICRSDREPVFMAALVMNARDIAADGTGGTQDGERFMLVAAAVRAGVVDLHGRQPVVLATPDARAWLDGGRSASSALRLAQSCALNSDAFDCFPVSSAVNEPGGGDGPRLIERVATRM